MTNSASLSNRLTVLAGQVHDANQAMRVASKEAAERALEAGGLLVEAKAECRHGEWLPFLARAGVPERQAQRLMLLARSGLKSDTVSDLGIKGALELAAKRRLPSAGKVLLIATGTLKDVPPCAHAWVWESEKSRGFYHVVGIAHDFASMSGTCNPVSADNPPMVFAHADSAIGEQFETLSFEELDFPTELLERLREGVIADEEDPPIAAFHDIVAELDSRREAEPILAEGVRLAARVKDMSKLWEALGQPPVSCEIDDVEAFRRRAFGEIYPLWMGLDSADDDDEANP